MADAALLDKNILTRSLSSREDCPKRELLRTSSSRAMSDDPKVGQDSTVAQLVA